MLDKYRVSQIMALLEEGQGIKTVARMTGTARNTVRRFQGSVKNLSHFLKMQMARQSVKVFVLT